MGTELLRNIALKPTLIGPENNFLDEVRIKFYNMGKIQILGAQEGLNYNISSLQCHLTTLPSE